MTKENDDISDKNTIDAQFGIR